MSNIREINVSSIEEAIYNLAIEAAYKLPHDIHQKEKESLEKEKSPVGKAVLETILQNVEVSAQGVFPLCQDTGLAVIFMEIGQDVHFIGGGFNRCNK